jgi:hypothetical protein
MTPFFPRETRQLWEVVLAAWNDGHDTAAIAKTLMIPEARVANLLARELDRSRGERP